MKNENNFKALMILEQWSPEQVDLIKSQVAVGATDNELKLFLYVANKTGLDPLIRQIYCVKRGGKMAIQTGIDGLRLIAQRSKEYQGQTKPEWCGKDGVWKELWVEKMPPFAARVGIWRKGFREACYGIARFDAYAGRTNEGNLTTIWGRFDDHMLAKCAEALGFRKAFPQETSDLYIPEELILLDGAPEKSEKVADVDEVGPQPVDVNTLKEKTINEIRNIAKTAPNAKEVMNFAAAKLDDMIRGELKTRLSTSDLQEQEMVALLGGQKNYPDMTFEDKTEIMKMIQAAKKSRG